MKNKGTVPIMKKIIAVSLLAILLGSIFVITPEAKDSNQILKTIEFTSSDFFVTPSNTGVSLNIPEISHYSTEPGKPKMPLVQKTLTFPITTTIDHISITTSGETTHTMIDKVELVPIPQPLSYDEVSIPTYTFYEHPEVYPNKWMDYSLGRGIVDGSPSIIVKINMYPIQYDPINNIIEQASSMTCDILYTTDAQENEDPISFDEDFSLIILTPREFQNNLQPLVDHKINRDITTKMIFLDEILDGTYFPVEGEDDQEQIKYFIKNAYDRWETQFVLLIGAEEQFPVRDTYVFLARDDGDDDEIIASDLEVL